MYFSKPTRIAAHEYLYQQGESSPELFHIRTGIVCLESVNERGDRCITHLLGQGAVLGHETLLRQPRGFDARICTDAVIEVISVSTATDETQKLSLMQWANAAVSRLLLEATQFKVQLHRARADEKVLLLIEQLQRLHPEKTEVCWLPSRYEMADILDINHATASRVIARLFRNGALVRTDSRDHVRVDWTHIRALRSS
jgi:CRP-like cAMP-binding protein